MRHAPAAHHGFDAGVNQLVSAIRPTLGPIPRTVAVERAVASMTPEVLDNGAVIARRILALPSPAEDVGAMYLRGLLWRVYEEVGDGTATAAVLFASLLGGGRRAVAAGYSAQRLRPHLEHAGESVSDELLSLARPLTRESELCALAASVCHDAELAALLSEIFDVIGAFGRLDVRVNQRRESRLEFVEGTYWSAGAHSTALLDGYPAQRAQLLNPAIILSDVEIDDPLDLVPVIEAARAADAGGLLIVCMSLSDRAAGWLAANKRRGTFPIVAVKTPGLSDGDRSEALDDLMFLVGGQPFRRAAGDVLRAGSAAMFGWVRRAWATRDHFGIIGEKGDACRRRKQVELLIRAMDRTSDRGERDRLLERLGRYQDGSATLWLAAGPEAATKQRVATAERSALVLRQALRFGVVAGGGASLLACQCRLQSMHAASHDPLAKTAYRIVSDALAVPISTIAQNRGREAAPVLAAIRDAGSGSGYEARTDAVADMAQAGILDPAAVLAAVVRTATHAAALALTIDTVVHRSQADATIEPEG